MSRKRRDVSGLWEGSAEEPVDRSPGVAPPPRRPAPSPVGDVGSDPEVPVPAAESAVQAVEVSAADGADDAAGSSVVAVVDDAAAEPVGAVSLRVAVGEGAEVDPLALMKTSFSFTQDQLAHLHKLADREDMWPSSLMGELLREAESTIRGTPRARRTKSRKGPRYVATTFYLERSDRELLDELAESTGRSRAAVGRLAIDASIQ